MDELTEIRNALAAPLPVPATARHAAAAVVDELIAAERGRRRSWPRLAALALAAAALVVVVLAATNVRPFDLDLFGDSNAPTAPDSVRAVFARMHAPTGEVDLGTIRTIGTFDLSSGHVTVYAAFLRGRSGYATAYERDGAFFGGTSYNPPPGSADEIAVGGGNLIGGVGGFAELSGLVPADVTSVRVRFADESSEPVPLHGRLFVYLVGGSRCEPAHRPVGVVASTEGGGTLTRDVGPPEC